MSTRLLDPAGAVEWLPVSPESEPSRSDLTLGKVVMLRADSMVVGLYVENGLQAGEPLRITQIEPCADRLVFAFHDGLRMSYNPDDRVPMQCLTLPCPPWCAGHWNDAECIHHGSEIFEVGANDAGEVMTVSAYRFDDPDGTCEPAAICLAFGAALIGEALDAITPAQARALGELLIRTADLVEGASK